jgi:hypothetical protein
MGQLKENPEVTPVPAIRSGNDTSNKVAPIILLTAALAIFSAGKACANPWEKELVNSDFVTQGGRYRFTGDFSVNADPAVIWDVLTDYGHIQDFVADFQGKILSRDVNQVLVQQSIGEGFLFFRFDVHALAEIHEQPYESIFSEDISHKDFDCFQEVWSLQPGPPGEGTKVICMMDIARNKHTPWFITPDILRSGLPNYLKQYRYEIERRENQIAKGLQRHFLTERIALPGHEEFYINDRRYK